MAPLVKFDWTTLKDVIGPGIVITAGKLYPLSIKETPSVSNDVSMKGDVG